MSFFLLNGYIISHISLLTSHYNFILFVLEVYMLLLYHLGETLDIMLVLHTNKGLVFFWGGGQILMQFHIC